MWFVMLMITKKYLAGLTPEEKDEIILTQAREIEDLKEQIQELKAMIIQSQALKKTKKNSKNSSLPPSQDQKANHPKKEKKTRKKRKGFARSLHPNPHEVRDIKVTACACGEAMPESAQSVYHEFDHVEIPPLEAVITRYRLYRGECPCCKRRNLAPSPEGIDPYKPFGPHLQHLLFYQRFTHFISYERLKAFCADVLNFGISEGAIANIFKRCKIKIDTKVEQFKQKIRTASCVNSDETMARVCGHNWWEWTFQNNEVALHVIRPSRGGDVVRDIFQGHKPDYWGSDLYSAQRGHGKKWQICLEHQVRDCQFAIDQGDQAFAWRMKILFLRAIAVSKRRHVLKPTTLQSYRHQLDRELTYILGKVKPLTLSGEKLRSRYLREREHLFTFFDNLLVEPTNNSSEQALRMSVIFRKVTNGFRSDWGTDLFAGVRSVVNTGLRQKMNPYHSLKQALQGS
jgi:transposase